QLLASLAEEGQQGVSEHRKEEEGIAPRVTVDYRLLESQAKAGVLEVSKGLFHCEAFAVESLDLGAFEIVSAAAKEPWLLHLLVLDTHHHWHGFALGCDAGASQHPHPAARAEPVFGRSPLSVGRLNMNHAAKA